MRARQSSRLTVGARALGVVPGLERSPSVRTLWRAVAQMVAGFNRVPWWVGWMQGILRVHVPEVPVYGIDGHHRRQRAATARGEAADP